MILNEKVSKKIKMLENLKSFQSLEHLKDTINLSQLFMFNNVTRCSRQTL